jgi:RNA polymerase sigma-70 factor, ECF subfamily
MFVAHLMSDEFTRGASFLPDAPEHALSDQALVESAIRGDMEAIRRVWQDHRRWVAAVMLAHKPHEVELEDLLQEVAMTVVRSISALRDAGVFKPWLRTVAINAARASGRKQTRRKARDRAHAHQIPPEPDDDAASPITSDEEGRRLLHLATQLPEGYREPLLLRCVRGLSYKGIAELTGLPETTIETRIARGRRMLRQLALEQPQTQGVRL